MASGKAPALKVPWIAGAPLTHLAKKYKTPRHVAVEETLRRLLSRFLVIRVSKLAADNFQPLQVGISTRSGTQTVINGVRRILNKFGTSLEYALFSVDLKNALNLCNRAAFLNAIQNLFPELLPWVPFCFKNDPAFLWTTFETIRYVAKRSLQRFSFAIVFHPIVGKFK